MSQLNQLFSNLNTGAKPKAQPSHHGRLFLLILSVLVMGLLVTGCTRFNLNHALFKEEDEIIAKRSGKAAVQECTDMHDCTSNAAGGSKTILFFGNRQASR